MASFASAVDLEEYLGNNRYLVLADRDDDGVADGPLVEAALERAGGTVRGHITAYLPLEAVPPEVVQANLDIATYYLAGNKVTEQEQKRFDDQIAWLRDVAKGLVKLIVPVVVAPVSAGTIEVVSEERMFTRGSLAGVM